MGISPAETRNPSASHATVNIGEFKNIPLIGIPESATLDFCDACGCEFHLSELNVTSDNRVVCRGCL